MNTITLVNGDDQFIFEKVAELEGFEGGSRTLVIEDLPARLGAVYINGMLGRRRLSWRSLIIDDVYQKRLDLIKVANVGELKTLLFEGCDGEPLQAYVEVDKLLMPYRIGRTPLSIEVIAPDPRFYSQTLQTVSTVVTDIGGGSPIPTPIPMSLTNSGISRPVVTNGGNFEAPPTFIIHGPGTTFIVQNITTGELFTLDTTLLVNEYITVDTINKTVIQGSNTNVFGIFDGTFWGLAPGDNEVHFNADTGSDSNTELEILFRDTYGGI